MFVVQIFFAIADFSFFCCSVIGNSVVIYVISRDKNLKSKSSYHILSVACADLLIGLFGIPLGVTAVSLSEFQFTLVISDLISRVLPVGRMTCIFVCC